MEWPGSASLGKTGSQGLALGMFQAEEVADAKALKKAHGGHYRYREKASVLECNEWEGKCWEVSLEILGLEEIVSFPCFR